jgi:hypothetical protein
MQQYAQNPRYKGNQRMLRDMQAEIHFHVIVYVALWRNSKADFLCSCFIFHFFGIGIKKNIFFVCNFITNPLI